MSALRTVLILLVVAGLVVAMVMGGGSSKKERDAIEDLTALETRLREGRFAAVAKGLEALPAARLPDTAARLRWSRLAMEIVEPAKAAEALRVDTTGDPVATEAARLLRAEALVRSGAIDVAEKELAALEKAGLRSDGWHYVHALVAMARGLKDLAIEHLEPLVRRKCRIAGVHVLWAQTVLDYPPEVERRLLEGVSAADNADVVRKGLGRHFLMLGEPARAITQLESVYEGRPWDRDARIDLARACRMGGLDRFSRAEEIARGLVAEDPADPALRLLLAEVLAAWSLADPSRAAARIEEAVAIYEVLAKERVDDGRTRMGILLGLARGHLELVGRDAVPDAPGTHFRRILEVLDEAEKVDPQGVYTDDYGVRLNAEIHFLRGKTYKRAHVKDDTEAIAHYEKAIIQDRSHFEATWDLALLYYDFMRKFKYQRRAFRLFEHHLTLREKRRAPPLPIDQMRMVWHNRQIVKERRDRGDVEMTPEDQKPVTFSSEEFEKEFRKEMEERGRGGAEEDGGAETPGGGPEDPR
jgi:tetratricopeptide (TPR) repeat protein